jgi:two-component system NtrC family sensor kinase
MQILVADDDPIETALLSHKLTSWGFTVQVAANGGQAWDVLTQTKPYLVLLDWMMPGVDGLELCRRIRRHPELAQAYVILLTARDGREDLISGLDAGADNYLIKPFDPEELRARLQTGVRVVQSMTEAERLLGAISSVLIGIDVCGHITRWNTAAQETFGIGAAEAMGSHLTTCGIKWADPAMVSNSLVQPTTPVRLSNVVFTDVAGRRRLIDLTITTMQRMPGLCSGFVLLGSEVTERHTLEEQLRQAHKLEAIGQLAAGVAHEINTPMQYIGDNIRFLQESHTSMLGLFQAVLDVCASRDTSDPKPLLDRVAREADGADLPYLVTEIPCSIEQSLQGVHQVSRIVQAMKDFSHPGTDAKIAVDVNRAIETTITVARNELKYVADTSLALEPELPLVLCLPGEINQVLLNLLINAAHAVGDAIRDGARGLISVSTQKVGEYVEIRITDTGTGIPPEIAPRIFEPFFTTKGVGRGTGQGLALAHNVIVKKHSGEIWFETELGKGTTFFIRLPLAVSTARAA